VNIKEIRQPKFQTMFTQLDLAKEEKRGTGEKGEAITTISTER